MTDEPEKMTTRDIVEYVEQGWDATELACFRQGIDGRLVGMVATVALLEAWLIGNVVPPEQWADKPQQWRLIFALEMIRRGAEVTEAGFDAELDAFLDDLTGDGDGDADGE